MTRIGLVLLVVLSFAVSIQAGQGYTLHEPSAEELLTVLSELNLSCQWGIPIPLEYRDYSTDPWDLCGYLTTLVQTTYRDELSDLPFDLLDSAYSILQPDGGWRAPGEPELWFEALILAWLRENPVDLDTLEGLTIGDLRIFVTPRDLNADGTNEYALYAYGLDYAAYYILSGDQNGRYRRVPDDLPFHRLNDPYWLDSFNALTDTAFYDFNANGLPEWLLFNTGAGYHGEDLGEVYLMEWYDGALRTVFTSANIVGGATNADDLSDTSLRSGFIFDNLDGDEALELQRLEITSDNWGCETTELDVFDWDASSSSYVAISDGVTRADSAYCVVDGAEQALYDHHYAAAADLYQYALLRYERDNPDLVSADEPTEWTQFIQLRLAQAYLLNREYRAADALLDALEPQPVASNMVQRMREVLLAHRNAPPGETCTALYNFFHSAIHNSINYGHFREVMGTSLTIGVPGKFYGDFLGAGNPADAAWAGCNVPGIVDPLLESLSGYVGGGAGVLERAGFPVVESISADFTGDGEDDLLFWIEADVPAVLLVRRDNQEPEIVRAYITRPGEFVTFATVPLPEDAGVGLVEFTETEGIPEVFSYSCRGVAAALGSVTFWQYTEGEFSMIDLSAWCADRPAVEDLIGVEDGVSVYYGRSGVQDEMIPYRWNSEVRRYVATARDSLGGIATVIPPTTEPSIAQLYARTPEDDEYYHRIADNVRAAPNLDAALTVLDAEIDAPYQWSTGWLHFWKATLLREAGRGEEAVAEYVATYEAGPESAYGQLAKLYFNPPN